MLFPLMAETFFLNEWVGNYIANNFHQNLNREKVQAHSRLQHLHNRFTQNNEAQVLSSTGSTGPRQFLKTSQSGRRSPL